MSEEKKDLGGGSGGGKDTQDQPTYHDGNYGIAANSLELIARNPFPPASSENSTITLLASNIMDMSGNVNMHGLAGVRITAGLPPLPGTASSSTKGVEIEVDELSSVTVKRGIIDGVDQKIEITPSGITVDGGAMPITIQSMTKITLSVMGGMSTLELGPDGITIQGMPMITIQGIMVKIN